MVAEREERRPLPLAARCGQSRRHVLKSVVAGPATLAIASVLGCGRREASPTAGTSQSPKRGGIFTHASRSNYFLQGESGFDPHTGSGPLGKVFGLFYQTLLDYDPRTFDPQPGLAQKWEQPSQTDYLFTLQPGVKWHNRPPVNGRALTIDDIIFSLERVQTDQPLFQWRTLLASIDKIERRDGSTLRITVKRPDAALLKRLSVDSIQVLAPEVLEKYDRLTTVEQVVGTGPFVLTAAQPGIGAEVTRNPDYWKPDRPYLDGVRVPHFSDDEVAYAAFLAGRASVVPIPGNQVKDYIARQGPSYTPDWARGTTIYAITYPNTRIRPFNDARVWKALRLLLDHDALVSGVLEAYFGRGEYGTVLPGALDEWDLTAKEYESFLEWKQPKDEAIKQALALLRAAGFSQENPLRFQLAGTDNFPTMGLSAPLMQAQWRQFTNGLIETTLSSQQNPVFLRNLASGNFAFGARTQSIYFMDPSGWLDAFRSTSSGNYTGFQDPRLDALFDKQEQTFDTQQRKAVVRELLTHMIENTPSTSTGKGYGLNGIQRNVRDWAPETGALLGRQYEAVWIDA